MVSDKEELERYIQVRESIKELKIQHENLTTNQTTLKKDVDDRFDKMDKKVDARFDRMDKNVDDRFDKMDKNVDDRFNKMDGKLDEILNLTNELKSDKKALAGGWKVITIASSVIIAIYTAVLQFIGFIQK